MTSRMFLDSSRLNQSLVNQYSAEVSSGIKVTKPGDSSDSSTIDFYQQMVSRIAGYTNRIDEIKGALNFQENILSEAQDTLIRAQELSTQAINGTLTPANRAQISREVWELRDRLVQLGNSKYLDKYIYGGIDSDDAPFDQTAYTTPATGTSSTRYAYDVDAGSTSTNNVQISDGLTIRVNTPGGTVFSNSINALERLGRAMDGYSTNPAVGAPDGTGTAYVFPTDNALQTSAIQNALDLIKSAQTNDLLVERTSIGGRLSRLDTASSVIRAAKQDAQDVLSTKQGADIAESATNLSQAQTALQASYQIGIKLLNQSILDYM
jgi:flagellar hook-associated protein 3 FlgL